MTNTVVIRSLGNAIEISPDGKSSLPGEIRSLLEPSLRYKYLRQMQGQQANDYSGRRRPVQSEWRLLYTYDKYGRMVCGAGLMPRIVDILRRINYAVINVDLNPPHCRKDRFTPDWDNVHRNFEFKPRQEECLRAMAENCRGIIDAPTGFGKTTMLKALGLLFNRARIAVTCKRKDIVQAMRSDLSTVLPSVGQVGGGVRQPGRVTVVTANSLHRLSDDDVDILVGEEGHELAADVYAKQLARFKQCRMYALTATPTGRLDNADMRLESLFGGVIFRMSYQEAQALGMVVPIRVRWIDVDGPNPCAGMVDVPKRRWGIWRHERRNAAIAAAARGFSDEEQVLIMVTTYDHAVHLRRHLPEFTLCYAERSDEGGDREKYVNSGLVSPDEPVMTPRRREDLRTEFAAGRLKKVIATDVWSTGVSFNGLAVLVRADARGSTILDAQIPGRVCRLNPATGKMEGLVIDCLDQFDPGFYGAARRRRKNYESRGWVQDMPRAGLGGLL